MRIFHVSDCFAPRVGGVEGLVRDLAQLQAREGHSVHVLTVEHAGGSGPQPRVEYDNDVAIHRLGLPLPYNAPLNPAAAYHSVDLLRHLQPDVVHAHGGTLSPFSLGVARFARYRDIPVAATWHSMLDRGYPFLFPFLRANGWHRAPVAWSAVSRVAARAAERILDNEVNVLFNGIDMAAWSPGETLPPAPPPLRCVATMRLVPNKRAVELVDIVADAIDDLAPGSITLDIFGDGPNRWQVERQIRRRNVGGAVTLRGWVPREELKRVYQQAHVFCVPTTREAFGLAGLEGRSSGLVVLARGGTGLEEYVTDGFDGTLAADDAAMSRQLVRMVSDQEAFPTMQANARSVRPEFGFERLLQGSMDEYARATAILSGVRTPVRSDSGAGSQSGLALGAKPALSRLYALNPMELPPPAPIVGPMSSAR